MTRPVVLRHREASGATPVTAMELFFDLVYVFAVTQLSHHLLEHLTARGAVQTTVLFLGVWWAWNYTAWATNWIDPDRPVVRALLLMLMLLSLIMSAAIPEAFAGRATIFAIAYVAIQLLRSSFMVAAFPAGVMRRNCAQLLAWSAIAGGPWIAGAFVDGDTRLALWAVAVVVDYAAPVHGFALPGAGRTPMQAWGSLAGAHLAERCQLVLLIARPGDAAVILGGPVIYLAGNAWFKLVLLGRTPWSRLIAIATLAALAPLAVVADPLLLTVAVGAVAITLAVVATLHPPAEEPVGSSSAIEVVGDRGIAWRRLPPTCPLSSAG